MFLSEILVQTRLSMSKYSRNFQEINEHWNDQIDFIKESILEFDNGNEKEARRLATAIRVMFHSSERSKSISIYDQLGKDMIFKSITDIYSPANLASSWLQLTLPVGKNEFKYIPSLDKNMNGRIFFMDFDDWWNQIIFDDKNNCFTRKEVVLFVANKDGGAHLDPVIRESYANIVKYNSIGWTDSNGNSPSNNPLYVAIRVISQEIIDSIKLDLYSSHRVTNIYKGHEMEMRFVNQGEAKRYPWSSTEVKSSPETQSIVNKHQKEPRKLYIREYQGKDKIRVEYIGR